MWWNITLYITVSGHRLFVIYAGQLRTCAYCANVEHRYAHCNRREVNRRTLPNQVKRGRGLPAHGPINLDAQQTSFHMIYLKRQKTGLRGKWPTLSKGVENVTGIGAQVEKARIVSYLYGIHLPSRGVAKRKLSSHFEWDECKCNQ